MRMIYPFIFAGLVITGAAMAQTPDPAVEEKITSAIRRGDLAAVMALVNAPGGREARNDRTALMNAAVLGNAKVAAAMLDAGAKVNEPSSRGFLALLLAIGGQHHEVIRVLLERGADPNIEGKCREKNCTGHPALPFASYLGDTETVQMLLARGADPNWKNGQAIEQANVYADLPVWRLLRAAAKQPAQPVETPVAVVPLGLTSVEKPLPLKVKAQPRGENCRVAIVADPAIRAAADLLAAELSAAGGIELLERAELDRIVAERKLIESFGAETGRRAGAALLGADAVLFVQQRDTAGVSVLEARLVRVSPGLVLDLVNAPFPLADAASWARLMSGRVASLAGKATQQKGVAISLLNIRAAQGRIADRVIEAQLTRLMADRLAHDSNCVLLERTAFNQLQAEAGADAFWAGKYFVDGAVELPVAGAGDATLRVRLAAADGGEPRFVEARGSANDPGRLVDAIMPRLTAALRGAGSPTAPDLRAEADRYAQEAQWAVACRMPLLAMRAADTAWALGNRSEELAKLRMKTASAAVLREAARIAGTVNKANPSWSGGPNHVRDLFRHNDRPADAYTPGEFIELSIRGLDAWRDSPAANKEWLTAGHTAIRAAAMTLMLFDTAEMLERHDAALDDLRVRLRSGIELALSHATKIDDAGESLSWLTEFSARRLPLWTFTAEEWLKSARALLAVSFPKDNAQTRLRVRQALLNGDEAVIKESLLWQEDVGGSQSGSFLSFGRPARTPRKVFAAWGREFDKAAALDDRAFARCAAHRAQAFGFRNPDLDAAAQAAVQELARQLPDDRRFTHAALSMHSQWLASKAGRELGAAAGKPASPEEKTAPPEPTASQDFANSLPASRLIWVGREALAQMPWVAKLDVGSLAWAEDSLWGYVERKEGGKQIGSIVRISLPDGRTLERINLPALPAATTLAESVRVFVTPKRFLVLARGRWVAVGDRASGKWHIEPGIAPSGAVAFDAAGDVLFLSIDDRHGQGVVRFDLRTRASELLVSTRRAPPVSPLDHAGLRLARIYFEPKGELIITAFGTGNEKVTAAWLPSRKTPWRTLDRTKEDPEKVESPFTPRGWQTSGFFEKRGDAELLHGILQISASGGADQAHGAMIRADRLPAQYYEPGWLEANPGSPVPHQWLRCAAGYVMTNANHGGAIWFLPASELPLNRTSAPSQ